jgi:prepilin-type N-terminal cleavage/methylation domain-containing protein
VAIRPPKYNSQGYTLIEMLVVMGIISIIAGFTVPSLLAFNKPLRDGTLQFKSHLSLVRIKAIASGKAYRIKPLDSNRATYTRSIPNKFVVEYAIDCNVLDTIPNGWKRASELDLDLPPDVGIINNTTPMTLKIQEGPPAIYTTVLNPADLNWKICFDNRGLVNTPTNFIIKDFQNNNKAKIVLFQISPLGLIDVASYDKNNLNINDPQTYQPTF